VEGRLHQVSLALPGSSVGERKAIAKKDAERVVGKIVTIVVQVILLENLPDAIGM